MNPLKPITTKLTGVKIENPEIRTYTMQLGVGYPVPTPGQFNMLGYPGIGEAPISFSALSRDSVSHTIRAVGMATHFVEKMEAGDQILVRGPYGKGWPMDAATGKDLLLISGGIGLAPIRPVINQVLARRSDFGNVIVLFGARNESGLIFTDEYGTWREARISLEITVDELLTEKPWPYTVGLITGLVDKLEIDIEKTVAFVCGPEMMMRFVCRGLVLKGLPAGNVYVSLERRMKCGVAQCGHCQHVGLFVCRDGPVFSYREVAGLYDGLL